MKKKILYTLLIASVCCSCKKKEEPDPCLVNGYSLTMKAGSADWCANTTLFADQAVVMTINGINADGSSLTLELDDTQPGTYPIKEDKNHVLYTSKLADGYESTNDNPGSLTIQSNDASTNKIKGTFTATVRSPISGNLVLSDGAFTLFYTE